jgi:hypothetical protein
MKESDMFRPRFAWRAVAVLDNQPGAAAGIGLRAAGELVDPLFRRASGGEEQRSRREAAVSRRGKIAEAIARLN